MTESTTTTTATAASSTTSCPEFDLVLTTLEHSLATQLLVSQDRCVDGLLDLYNLAPSPLVQDLVVAILDDIRHLSAVRASDLRARLTEVSAAVAVELAFCG